VFFLNYGIESFAGMHPTIHIKRVYDPPLKTDRYRVLVDRLWPRGLTKEEAEIDEWAKDIAPSPDLRKWFGHKPEHWSVFQKKYTLELSANEAVDAFITRHEKQKLITLVYAAKDEAHTHAIVLQQYLQKRFQSR